MFLGALLDAGAPLDALEAALRSMRIDAGVAVHHVARQGIAGIKVSFHLDNDCDPPRRFNDFKLLLERSRLPQRIQGQALTILKRLFEAEARVHVVNGGRKTTGRAYEEVCLHELGSYDTLLDVVGVLVLMEALGIEAVFASPLPVPRGMISASHGTLPVPAPAVALLMEGVPAYGVDLDQELVTPTGLAILRHLTRSFGPFPDMVVRTVGYGAGERDVEDRPNMLRIWLGELVEQEAGNQVTEIVTVIDDLSGELLAHAQKILFEKGAVDVYITPVIMKKGRPGFELHVLAPPGQEERLVKVIFNETSTLGVRFRRVERICLPRGPVFQPVGPFLTRDTCPAGPGRNTSLGDVRVKEAAIFGKKRRYVEYEDAAKLSEKTGVPLIDIYRALES